MRLSFKQISELQALLHELTGIEYSPEEAQTAGLAIVRFVCAKELQNQLIQGGQNEDNMQPD